MTQCGLWMDGKWVKTPLTPLERNQVKWGSSGTYLSGGGYAVNSATSHYEISAQWAGTQDELDPIIEILERGTAFHMVDPFSRKNILPFWLANPWYMTQDAPNVLKATVKPTAIPGTTQGATFPTGANSTGFDIAIPTGSTVRFRWNGTGSGLALNGVTYTPNVTHTITGLPSVVKLAFTTTTSKTINNMFLSLEPSESLRGRGYSKVKCTGWTVTGYTAAEEIERIGLSATFVEVGGWN